MQQSARRKSTMVAMLALAVTALMTVGATAVEAAPPVPPHGHMYNEASPRCLDSGTPQDAQLWTCVDSPYQRWLYTGNSTIAASTPGGCLDAGAALNGSLVRVAPCSGVASQKWFWTGAVMINQATGRCLDADLGTIGSNGTKVQVWDCTGGANQNWDFEFWP